MFADALYEQILSTGTGDITLTGVTKPSYRCALRAVGTGNSFMYWLRHPENLPGTGITEWEVGIGTLTEASFGSDTGTMSRSVLASSNAGSAVNFTAGTKELICYPSAALLDALYAPIAAGVTGSGGFVLETSPTIITPTIASFLNATHNHQDAAGGGTLDAAAINSGTIATARLPQDLTTSGTPTFGALSLIQSNNGNTVLELLKNTHAGSAAVSTLQITNSGLTASLLASVYSAAHSTKPDVVLVYSAAGTPLSFGANGANIDVQIGLNGDLLVNTTSSPSANGGGVVVLGDNAANPTLVSGTVGLWNNGGELMIGKAGSSPLNLTGMQPLGVLDSPTFVSLRVGTDNTAPADGSLITGVDGTDRGMPNAQIHASGHFSADGDSQAGRYLTRVQTRDAVSTPATQDGNAGDGTNQVLLPSFATYLVRALVCGRRTDVAGDVAGYVVSCVVSRGNLPASTAVIGVVQQEVVHESDASWDATLFADTTFGAIQVLVTGAVGKTINWTASIQTVELVG